MKLPRSLLSAALACSLLAIQTAPAHAFVPPASPYTIPNARAVAQALAASGAAWGASSLISNTGVATVATAGGGTLGLAPVAGIATGLAVAGLAYYISVNGTDGLQRDLLILVGSASFYLNPDYGLTAYQTVKGPWVWPSYPYINTSNAPGTDSEFKNLIINQLIASAIFYAIDSTTFEIPSTDSSTPSSSTRMYFRFKATLPSSPSNMQWFGSYIDKTIDARTCQPGYSYSVETTGCILLNDTIKEDQTCRVSYDASGNPIYNVKDPDCQLATSGGGMTIQAPTTTTPAVVSITDPGTGKLVKTELYTNLNQGYAPGTFRTTERVPDTKNSVVRESSTLMTAPSVGSAPVVQQSVQKTYDGTNVNPTSTQVPLDRITVANWPTSLEGLGTTMSQVSTNTATTATNTSEMVSQLRTLNSKLDNLKPSIDTAVPAESSTLPQSAPADLDARNTNDFLKPLKDKLAGFASFEFPAHTASCPAFAFTFDVWSIHYDVNSNYMCNWLDEHRSLLAGLMYFTFLMSAILIVLGA